MRNLVCLALYSFTALSAVPAFSDNTLFGSQVTGTLYFPNLFTVFSGPITATVGPAVEFPVNSLAFDGSLDVTANQIIWTATLSVTYGSGAFNAFKLDFAGAPTITGVSLDAASTLTPVSFSAVGRNEVLLNVAFQFGNATECYMKLVTLNRPDACPLPPWPIAPRSRDSADGAGK